MGEIDEAEAENGIKNVGKYKGRLIYFLRDFKGVTKLYLLNYGI